MLKTTASEKKAKSCAENASDIDCACYKGVNEYIENSKTAIANYKLEMTAYKKEKTSLKNQLDADIAKYEKDRLEYKNYLSDALIKLKHYDCWCCGLGQSCICDLDRYDAYEKGAQLVNDLNLETEDVKKVSQGIARGTCSCSISCKIKQHKQGDLMDKWDNKNPPPNRNDYERKQPTLVFPLANITCVECNNIIKNVNADSNLENIRQECNVSIYKEQQGRKKKDGGEGEGKGGGESKGEGEGKGGGESKGKGKGGGGKGGAPKLSIGLISGIASCGLGVLLLIIALILKVGGGAPKLSLGLISGIASCGLGVLLLVIALILKFGVK